jgi:hypothetical protein
MACCSQHTFVLYWGVLGMYLKFVQIMGIPMMIRILSLRAMVPWKSMKMHLLLNIYKQLKVQLD